MTPTFFPHQIDAIHTLLPTLQTTGGAYLAHDTGIGKTLTAITLARLLKAQRVLVITTVAGLGVWRGEIDRWWPTWPADCRARIILNYDKLNPGLVKDLLRHEWDLLILDEAQYAKNPRSQRSKAVAKLAKAAKRRLLLSGTPAHSPLDYHAQYRLIAPNERPWCLPPSQYKQLICKLEGPYNNWVKGFKAEEVRKVEAEMARYSHKAVKEELHLPEPIETVVPIQLGEPEQRAYRTMSEALRVELRNGAVSDAPIVLTKILRLQQITSGFLRDQMGKDHSIGTSKLDACMDLIDERPNHKIVVAYRFTWEREALGKRLQAMKLTHSYIDGSVPEAVRTATVHSFQNYQGPYVLLLQYQAGGTSITLTAADAMIIYSASPSVIEMQQVMGRIHRIGTTTHVQYLWLLADGTVDEDMYAGLKAKADVVKLTSLLKRRIGV